ncbi:MAG: DUF433 domain-containing protein [Chloroflexi bacterium]|nr:DUF433 domain-containing protein [Chloroflexota bacterium]
MFERIVSDPGILGGKPCIKGTRISTESLWALHSAGDSIPLIARSYALSKEQVETAIAWEEELAQVAA